MGGDLKLKIINNLNRLRTKHKLLNKWKYHNIYDTYLVTATVGDVYYFCMKVSQLNDK